MTTFTFDQAQALSWAQDTESPAEREEREATQAGMWDTLDTAAEWAALDQAEDEYFAWCEFVAAHHAWRGERPCE